MKHIVASNTAYIYQKDPSRKRPAGRSDSEAREVAKGSPGGVSCTLHQWSLVRTHNIAEYLLQGQAPAQPQAPESHQPLLPEKFILGRP